MSNLNMFTAMGKTCLKYGFNHYATFTGNRSQMWDKIKVQTKLHGVTIIEFNTFANQYDATPDGFLYPEPSGTAVNGHYVAVIGYSNTKDEVYFLDSRELSFKEGYQIRGISKNYWMNAGRGGVVPY
jgi:hypothetical protein